MSLQVVDGEPCSSSALAFTLQGHRQRGLPSSRVGSLERLLRRIGETASTLNKRGLLERDQEQQLAKRWHGFADRAAIEILVTSHLGLAAKMARRYRGYGITDADLISEANLGLVTAATRFEANRGARFSTYALWWIRAMILDYILRSSSLVRIGTTKAEKKLFFRLRREMRNYLGQGASLTPQLASVIAQQLAVRPRDVIEMDRRLGGDLSLNALVSKESGEEWQDLLIEHSPTAETLLAEQDESTRKLDALRSAINVLTVRERRVFVSRRLTDPPPRTGAARTRIACFERTGAADRGRRL
jgi:RNA polymerase sigma-32 factor